MTALGSHLFGDREKQNEKLTRNKIQVQSQPSRSVIEFRAIYAMKIVL